MLEHGVLAPDWRLAPAAVQPPDAPGGPADLLGRPALLLFFSIGCAGCTGRAIPFAKALAARYPGLRVLAIHSQPGGQRPPEPERVRAVTCSLDRRDDGVPAACVEPEPGDEDDVHG